MEPNLLRARAGFRGLWESAAGAQAPSAVPPPVYPEPRPLGPRGLPGRPPSSSRAVGQPAALGSGDVVVAVSVCAAWLCGTGTLKVSNSRWLKRRSTKGSVLSGDGAFHFLVVSRGCVHSPPPAGSGRGPRGPQPEAARWAGSGGARAGAGCRPGL